MRLTFGVFVLTVVVTLRGQEVSTDLATRVREVVEAELKSGAWTGLVVGLHVGGEDQVFGFGKISPEDDRVPDGTTFFEIGSITKTFTSIALADLEREGKLKVSDLVSTHLPEGWVAPMHEDTPIRLEDLATHTSGLPRLPTNLAASDGGNPYADYDSDRLKSFLASYRLRRAPRSRYEYSNLGVGMLGEVLARLDGKNFDEMIRARICEPLGMKDTRQVLSAEDKTRLAPGTVGSASKPARITKNWDFTALAGAGALRSTANDMLRYLRAQLGEGPEACVKSCLASHLDRKVEAGAGCSVGLGWHITTRAESKAKFHWHNGGTGGYRSFCAFSLTEKVAIVLLSNRASDRLDPLAMKVFNLILP